MQCGHVIYHAALLAQRSTCERHTSAPFYHEIAAAAPLIKIAAAVEGFQFAFYYERRRRLSVLLQLLAGLKLRQTEIVTAWRPIEEALTVAC